VIVNSLHVRDYLTVTALSNATTTGHSRQRPLTLVSKHSISSVTGT